MTDHREKARQRVIDAACRLCFVGEQTSIVPFAAAKAAAEQALFHAVGYCVGLGAEKPAAPPDRCGHVYIDGQQCWHSRPCPFTGHDALTPVEEAAVTDNGCQHCTTCRVMGWDCCWCGRPQAELDEAPCRRVRGVGP